MAAFTRPFVDVRQVMQAISDVDDIYDTPIHEADRRHARHRPCDSKFVDDWISCGTTRLVRHGLRQFRAGHVGAGSARLLGAPFLGALAALALVPAGLGYWVGRSVSQHRCKRGLERSEAGIQEDKLATAVLALQGAMAACGSGPGDARYLGLSDSECMGVAGDARQVLWDLEYQLRAGKLTRHRLSHATLLKVPIRRTVRIADALDDQRRKRAAASSIVLRSDPP